MNNKSNISKGFNKHFFDFLNDISSVHPNNSDIKYAITSFETIKKLNVTAIIKVWYKNVYGPYQTEIDSGNIDLSSYTGGNVYIAFKYVSTSSGSATYEIDNVLVVGE